MCLRYVTVLQREARTQRYGVRCCTRRDEERTQHLATVAVQLPTVCAVRERVSGRLMYVVEQACAVWVTIATGWCFFAFVVMVS